MADKLPNIEKMKDELVKAYPPKVARKRAKSIIINDKDEKTKVVPEIQANIRTVPGIITQRGCTYAGCRGVVLGPTRDILQIVHGPIGCAYYSWMTRRNQTSTTGDDQENYMTYSFSTNMDENEIVFGGEKKLKQAIQEAYDIFKPKAIAVFSTCPIGLIGDDVHAVAKEMKNKLGINVFAFSCEGYKGVSQSAGHHIANNGVFKHIVGTNDEAPEGKFKMNMLGEYNIGGDAFELERMLETVGITLVGTFSGNSTYDDFAKAHTADLNVVMCHRSINYVANMIEKKYGVPWFKVNFIGADSSAKSMRKIVEYFGDKELIAKTEEFVKAEMAEVEAVRKEIYNKHKGKTAMLFVGGSRGHHYQDLFSELGIKTIAAGYEFAHRDDYEGVRVLPTIKIDADSRNIEELHVEQDPEKFRARKTKEEIEQMEKSGFEFSDYDGMMYQMNKGTFVIDDISQHETEKLLETYRPDIFCAGIKEKYIIQKMGIPMKQLHSYDYGGPYAGFKGAINFYKEIDRMLCSRVFNFVKAPWQKKPELAATYAHV